MNCTFCWSFSSFDSIFRKNVRILTWTTMFCSLPFHTSCLLWLADNPYTSVEMCYSWKKREKRLQECFFEVGCCALLMQLLQLPFSFSNSIWQGCPGFLVPTFANTVLWSIPAGDWASSCPLLPRTSWPAATIHLHSPWLPVLASAALSEIWSRSWDECWTLKPVIPVTMGASRSGV